MKPTIIIDDKIPFVKGVLDDLAQVRYVSGTEIMPSDVLDADALIIRTRTKCDEALLKGSAVKCIATATIGFDHIDREYCQLNNIQWANVPGCNASSVQQYIAASLMFLQEKYKIDISSQTIGIVGVGSVGTLVADFCRKIGMTVLLNDPPRERLEKNNEFVSLDEIAEKSNIITFHTPLYLDGVDKTYHLADEHFFSKLTQKPFILNAARGEVVDSIALKKAKEKGLVSGLVLDCWEHEPNIDVELLKMTDIATPHIAGYSADGKSNATVSSIRFMSRCFNLGIDNWQVANIPLPENRIINITDKNKDIFLSKSILHTYDIQKDSCQLKSNFNKFEFVRGNYPLRREFSSYIVQTNQYLTSKQVNLLKNIGFCVID